MTLKTFHFAGVASMNITLGVPRIKEIINAVKKISTPIITAYLVNDTSQISARIVKGRIEKTKLTDICEYIQEVMTPSGCYLEVKISTETLTALKLEITIEKVIESILDQSKPRLNAKNITKLSNQMIAIEAPNSSKDKLYFSLQTLKINLSSIIVNGFEKIERAVISKLSDTQYYLIIEGIGMKEIMSIPGIKGTKTRSNNILEVEECLGIEAGRETIFYEMKYTLQQHGITIDSRHLSLLADTMTYNGKILAITRHGVSQMKESTFMLASFEKTVDHLFDAAVMSKKDDIIGVSESIIIGKPLKLGTGLFDVFWNCSTQSEIKEHKFLFDDYKEKVGDIDLRV